MVVDGRGLPGKAEGPQRTLCEGSKARSACAPRFFGKLIQKGNFLQKFINQWIYGNSNPFFRMLQINRNVVLCFLYYLLDYTLKGLISK